MPTSKSIRQLEARIADVEPGSVRYQTLEAAKRFKSSWIELGRMLWMVYKEKKFREWGYLTFDAYCAKEIAIRATTAKRLLHSYYFLEKEEPSFLKRLTEDPPAALPSPDSVNLLRLLKAKQEVPQQNYQQVRSYVLEKGKEAPEIRREVRSVLESIKPRSETAEIDRRHSTVRRMIGTLKAVRMELATGQMVPKKLLNEIESLVKKLEGVI